MTEFVTLDRCAAYVAARDAAVAVQRAALAWPPVVADAARRGVLEALQRTASAISYPSDAIERRQYLRDALGSAIAAVGAVDAARAIQLAPTLRDSAPTLDRHGGPGFDAAGDTVDDPVGHDADATYDVDRAAELDELLRLTGRSVALLAMLLHASTGSVAATPQLETTPGRVSHSVSHHRRLTRPVPTRSLRR